MGKLSTIKDDPKPVKEERPKVLKKITFNVADYGATGDGETNNTEAINKAIRSCADAGGGTVYFPAGKYLTGAITLRSNVTLNISAGATILGSRDLDDFPLVENISSMRSKLVYSSLINGSKLSNVAITGRGIIDGQGQVWWELFRGKRLSYPRGNLIGLRECKNVLIRDLTLKNSPFWTVGPIFCENVTIDNLTILNPPDSPNTDGINPDSCRNVRISNCYVDAGDDCVAIKSGKQDDPRRVGKPCENIIIANCVMGRGHGGVVIGSEMSGGVKNVVVSNCVFNDTDRGIRIKTLRGRGGVVEDVRVNNIIMKRVHCPFVINMHYFSSAITLADEKAGSAPGGIPVIRNIHFSNIAAHQARVAAGFLYGLPDMPIESVTFDNVVISMDKEAPKKGASPAMMRGPKEAVCEGFFCKNVRDIEFNNVKIVTTRQGPAFKAENVEDIKINGFDIRKPPSDSSAIEFKHVKNARISRCSF